MKPHEYEYMSRNNNTSAIVLCTTCHTTIRNSVQAKHKNHRSIGESDTTRPTMAITDDKIENEVPQDNVYQHEGVENGNYGNAHYDTEQSTTDEVISIIDERDAFLARENTHLKAQNDNLRELNA